MMKRLCVAALILSSCLWPSALVRAQNSVVIDWKTKTLLQAPSEVNVNTAVNVSIRNVNDFLYKYDVTVKATPRSIDDFSKIPSTGVTAAALGLSCTDKAKTAIVPISDLENVIDAKIRPQADKNGDYPSIPIGVTVAAWNTNIEVPMKAAQQTVASLREALRDPIANCVGADDNAKRADANSAAAILRKYDDIDAALGPYRTQLFGSDHEINFVYTLRPETDYSISIDEKYLVKTTLQGAAEFKFSPASTILTLSAGPLITWIPNRSYVSSTVPTASGGTQNVLTVNDFSGPQLQLATLLNYRVPLPNSWGWAKTWNTSDEAGIAVSTGPVFRLSGSNSGTSSFGYFTGVSLHLWQRFFVTPGVHIGEFADFPAGFERGTTIPPSFGTLTPVKRWTVRFAIGITFKAVDLSKVVTKPSGGAK
jgi:hypothetical protein